MRKVYIVGAKRSAIGSFLGSLSKIEPKDFAAQILTQLLDDLRLDKTKIDEVIIGHVLSTGLKQNLARQISLLSKIPQSVPSYNVNMVCGSGMKSILNGFLSIKAGRSELVIAGGVEGMSHAPHFMHVRNQQKLGDKELSDTILHDALTDAFLGKHMGCLTEEMNRTLHITRAMQDSYSYTSQQRALHARKNGRFKDEIIPVKIKDKNKIIIFDQDEYMKETTTIEKLSTLKPAFKEEGTITAGNASGLNDGASFIVLASEAAVQKYGLTPMAEMIDYEEVGVEPAMMGLAPFDAITKLLDKQKLTLNDLDLLEINESFALQLLGVTSLLSKHYQMKEEVLFNKLNIYGGAIALGHPIGASGNRIIVTLINQLTHEKKSLGLASLCIGGGMGLAMLIKRV